ncbi:MAG: formylglycine-generating enzyme family protein [Snowella sp.]|nr:formylglycine-generating enzyme family protein [Snowella sp.]
MPVNTQQLPISNNLVQDINPILFLSPKEFNKISPVTSQISNFFQKKERYFPDLNYSTALRQYKFQSVTVNVKGEITQWTPGIAQYYREKLDKGIYLDMVYIPGGTFMMGSPASEKKTDWSDGREEEQHLVTLEPFWMGKFAVTQKQWRAIMGWNPSRFKNDQHPVEQVSWNHCQQFCQKLSEFTGKNYRLPSEAQWEYACRAGTTTPFNCGETLITDLVNYDGTEVYAAEKNEIFWDSTEEVGLFPPNAYGLYDMHGNVWEWCEDEWHDNYDEAPSDGSAWVDNHSDSDGRIIRGGSWHSHPIYCRSANRYYFHRNFSISYLGCRVVCGDC